MLGEDFGHRELSTQTVGFLGYGHVSDGFELYLP